MSPDGKNIYANSYDDSAVIELKRNPETGGSPNWDASRARWLVKQEPAHRPSRSPIRSAWRSVPTARTCTSRASAKPPSPRSNAWNREASPQLPEPHECVTSNSSGCGKGSTELIGLDGPRRLTVSPDGLNVYVAGQSASTVVELDRAQALR